MKAAIRRHIRKHKNMKQFRCPECLKSISTVYSIMTSTGGCMPASSSDVPLVKNASSHQVCSHDTDRNSSSLHNPVDRYPFYYHISIDLPRVVVGVAYNFKVSPISTLRSQKFIANTQIAYLTTRLPTLHS